MEQFKTLNRGPHVSVAGFIFDGSGRMLMLHRANSDAVRSAKNCWSFPSGLHEEGLTLPQQLAVELDEELGLKAVDTALQVGTYENIATVDRWHWVITMYVQRVATFDTLINREPDKHDDIQLHDVATFDPSKIEQWAPHLHEFVVRVWPCVRDAIVFNLGGIPLDAIVLRANIDPVWAEAKVRADRHAAQPNQVSQI